MELSNYKKDFLKDKNILVTGASRGIGKAIAIGLSDYGANIIMLAKNENQLDQIYDEIKSNSETNPLIVGCDLNTLDENKAQEIANVISRDYGHLDALINNAAISPKNEHNKRLNFIDTPIGLWRNVFNVNFFAPIIMSKALIKNLQLAKGMVINITSIASDSVHEFAGPAYGTSKAALKSLTREMAADLSKFGIRVNAIAPGEIETSMISENSENLLKNIPMGRFGKPEEVASVIHSMCSESFSYVNGTEIEINGGQKV